MSLLHLFNPPKPPPVSGNVREHRMRDDHLPLPPLQPIDKQARRRAYLNGKTKMRLFRMQALLDYMRRDGGNKTSNDWAHEFGYFESTSRHYLELMEEQLLVRRSERERHGDVRVYLFSASESREGVK